MLWFENIQSKPADVVSSTDDTLMTSQPEDMFNVIHMQLSVADEKLPKEHLRDVVNGVIQVLQSNSAHFHVHSCISIHRFYVRYNERRTTWLIESGRKWALIPCVLL
jgi:hypothetical protein